MLAFVFLFIYLNWYFNFFNLFVFDGWKYLYGFKNVLSFHLFNEIDVFFTQPHAMILKFIINFTFFQFEIYLYRKIIFFFTGPKHIKIFLTLHLVFKLTRHNISGTLLVSILVDLHTHSTQNGHRDARGWPQAVCWRPAPGGQGGGY